MVHVMMPGNTDPLPGTIHAVHPAGVWIGVTVFTGHPTTPVEVHHMPLIQDGEKPPQQDPYAVWMPYQKGQAAKTEALEARLGGGNGNG
jgi:hypothetical protein